MYSFTRIQQVLVDLLIARLDRYLVLKVCGESLLRTTYLELRHLYVGLNNKGRISTYCHQNIIFVWLVALSELFLG